MMSESLFSLPLEPDLLKEIVEDAKDFAFARGMVMKVPEGLPYSHAVTFLPFTLFPSQFPKLQFDLLCQLQNDINFLYYRVTNDYEFLRECLKGTIEADSWTRRLWGIYDRSRESQKDVPSLAIIRSDYMLGQDGLPKQVEVNTISAGFGGVSRIAQSLHGYVLRKMRRTSNLDEHKWEHIAQSLARSWSSYVELHNSPNAVICFAVEDQVYNTYDQRHIELLLIEKYAVPAHQIIRKSNSDFVGASRREDGALFIEGKEIALLYLRTWYSPSQLLSEAHWEARETIEQSRCIKCPNLAWQLAGCKKVQQVLTSPGVLEKFCSDDSQVNRIRKVFVGLYALEERRCYEMVLSNPENFVLKPQREGGGNNIFGMDIPTFVKELPEGARQQFIAMEIIKPILKQNYLVSKDSVSLADVVNEIGIFGCILASTQKIIFNHTHCGGILRTKNANCKETGIASGFGYLDSLFLV